jgi:hypothetical protein
MPQFKFLNGVLKYLSCGIIYTVKCNNIKFWPTYQYNDINNKKEIIKHTSIVFLIDSQNKPYCALKAGQDSSRILYIWYIIKTWAT